MILALGRAVEGPIELRFHAWDLDRFGDRDIFPYHVKLSIEGIPHHAWYQEIADKVLCDEAVIHHVEEVTRRRIDQRAYQCWVFTKDPSRIPQVVYLSLLQYAGELNADAQIHFVRPKGIKRGHVFRILVHIDFVEDLLFYHYPREELVVDGKVPWRDFNWQFGRPDGDLDEDVLHPPRSPCRQGHEPRRHPRDDDDGDRDQKRPKAKGIIKRVSS